MSTNQKIQIAGAAVLLLCALPLPYGFYTIGRTIVTIIGAYLAFDYFSHNKSELALTFTAVAVVFQPFIRLGIGREVWLVIDIAVAILLLLLALNKK